MTHQSKNKTSPEEPGLSIMAGGRDRTQEMFDHMTMRQMRSQAMAGVTNAVMADFADRVLAHMNERKAHSRTAIDLALLNATSWPALAVAMPRVRLHHPAHPTLQ